MPTYQIQDPIGRTLEIEGDQPPSESELDEIFSKTGGKTQPEQESNPLASWGKAFGSKITEGANQFGSGLGKAAYETFGGAKQEEENTASRASSIKNLLQLSRQARQSGDVERADRLLKMAGGFSSMGQSESEQRLTELEQAKGDVLYGGAKTAMTTIGAPVAFASVPAAVTTLGMGSAFGGLSQTGSEIGRSIYDTFGGDQQSKEYLAAQNQNLQKFMQLYEQAKQSGDQERADKLLKTVNSISADIQQHSAQKEEEKSGVVRRIAESAGSGAAAAVETAGVTRFTNPLTGSLVNKVGGTGATPAVAKAVVGGGANVAENEAIARLKGQSQTPQEAATAFLMGAGSSAINQASGKGHSISEAPISEQMLNPAGSKGVISDLQNVGEGVKGAAQVGANVVGGAAGLAKDVAGKAALAPFKAAYGLSKKVGEGVTGAASKIRGGVDTEMTPVEAATQVMPLVKDNLTESAEHVANVLKTSDSNNVGRMATDMRKVIKNGGKIIEDRLAQSDAAMTEQSARSVAEEIAAKLSETSEAQANPALLEQFKQDLVRRLTENQEGDATNLSQMNRVRTSLNSQLDSFYRKGQAVTTDADVLSFLKAKAALMLKNQIGDAVPEVKDVINRQHSAIIAEPVLSAAYQGGGLKYIRGKMGAVQAIVHPFTDTVALKSARDSLNISDAERELSDQLLHYGNRKTTTPKINQENVPFWPGKEQGMPKPGTIETPIGSEPNMTPVATNTEGVEGINVSGENGVALPRVSKYADQIAELEATPKKTAAIKAELARLQELDRAERLSNLPGEGLMTPFVKKNETLGQDNLTKPFSESKPELEPLMQEARKYKSAEEFIKAQGKTLYHGTPAKFDTKDFRGGYLTADKNYADIYKNPRASSISYGSAGIKNKLSGEPRTLEFVLPENAKIFDYTNAHHKKLLDDYWNTRSMSGQETTGESGQIDWTEGENLREFFDEKGIKFDGIKLDEAGGIDPISGVEIKRSPSVLIINPKILKDKSQLTDIWNQANKPSLTPSVGGSANNKYAGIELDYVRNPDKSTYMGNRFGQNIEPSGKYMTLKESGEKPPSGWETGKIKFKNPLVIDFGGGYKDKTNWKNVLSDRYNGLVGKELSIAIKKDGYDGIITLDNGNPSEVISLSPSGGGNAEGGKSVTTSIQGRYAKETPKSTETGRRNISAEVIKRAIETKSPNAQERLLSDFPAARNPETMSRRDQEKFLALTKKQRYR